MRLAIEASLREEEERKRQ